jgi:hypothetical protein
MIRRFLGFASCVAAGFALQSFTPFHYAKGFPLHPSLKGELTEGNP